MTEYHVQPDNTSLLLFYITGDQVEYWKWLLDGRHIFEQNAGQFNVTQKVVEFVLTDTAETMGISREDIPEPTIGAVHIWDSDPVGFAWYAIKPGFDYRDVRERMSKPDDDYEVYTATFGEYLSSEWMNGGVQTAEYILVKHFGLKSF